MKIKRFSHKNHQMYDILIWLFYVPSNFNEFKSIKYIILNWAPKVKVEHEEKAANEEGEENKKPTNLRHRSHCLAVQYTVHKNKNDE